MVSHGGLMKVSWWSHGGLMKVSWWSHGGLMVTDHGWMMEDDGWLTDTPESLCFVAVSQSNH